MDNIFKLFPPPIRPDIADALEVFVYTNLSGMVSPRPEVILTPEFIAALVVALNNVGVRHNIELNKDLKDIVDVFIITQVPQISAAIP